jgi:hypothetical protein
MNKWYGCKAKSDDNWKASKDHAQAFAAALGFSDNDAEAAELLVAWAERRADVIVDQLWAQIHKLAFALLEHDSLTGAQVKAILDGRNGSAPNAAAKMSGGGKSGDSQAP